MKLDGCKIEFEGDFAKKVESIRSSLSETLPLTINKYTASGILITEFEQPAYKIVKTEYSDFDDIKPEIKAVNESIGPLPSHGQNGERGAHTKIKREYSTGKELIEEFKCHDETVINAGNSTEQFGEPRETTLKCDLNQPFNRPSCPTRSGPSPTEIMQEIVDDIVSMASIDPSSPKQPIQTPFCVRSAVNEILINVSKTEHLYPDAESLPETAGDDPFLRRSEILELIEQVLANRLPPIPEFHESPMSLHEVYGNIQKLPNDSKLIENKTVAPDIPQYFEQNVQHSCNTIERYIQTKIEVENDFVNGEQWEATTAEDAHPMPMARMKQNVSKCRAKQPNLVRSMEPKRFCGGQHTLTASASRLTRRGNSKDQYIDLLAEQMKNQLDRKKKPPEHAFKRNNCINVNVCNCNMDASDGFIICGTASRKKFQ